MMRVVHAYKFFKPEVEGGFQKRWISSPGALLPGAMRTLL